ncbi:MAG: radical SAM family heme chaperone HemW [Fusobacterium sp.]|uniref:radical SAM family heme chaperone HemW n=1 Tax=Fusobacterium sp. TaxID=68766 RepID=UPI0026DD794C|nr:radical SAM family heme chaperone HemW [Fusobacterium sp.]MDO4690330.1 radical SAM family heme chaperone HemW [Fusobacterium sp.]
MLKVYNTYVHIPFCEKKCNYCDFTSFKFAENLSLKYVNYLLKEIELYKKKYDLTVKQDTIYFGGGTPSLLSIDELKRILANFNYDTNTEITIEVNPKTVNKEKLKKYKELGINRLSIGVQTFNNKFLKKLGRVHSSSEAEKIYCDAREVGFENISIDLMFSLPAQTLEDLERDLNKLFSLKTEHFSIYSLIWEEGTEFYKELIIGKLKETENELEAQMYEKIIELAEKNGYKHYEISNFSKPGLESRHNMIYWENKNYLGLGLAAAGYLENIRYKNYSNFNKYYKKLDLIEFPMEEKEILSQDEIDEYGYLVGFRILGKKMQATEKNRKIFQDMEEEGYLKKNGDFYIMTKKALMFFNDFISNFI